MGQINVRIPDELERRLRVAAFRKFGFRKGALTKAIVEAIEEWLSNNEEAST